MLKLTDSGVHSVRLMSKITVCKTSLWKLYVATNSWESPDKAAVIENNVEEDKIVRLGVSFKVRIKIHIG